MFKKSILAAGMSGLFILTGMLAAQEIDESVSNNRGDQIVSVPRNVRERLKDILPDAEVMGGRFIGKSRFYGENLWEYINGAAEAFHSYDFIALLHQDYGIDDSEITVDIYDMGSLIRAFGMYASERSPDYHFLNAGAEGYGDAFGLNFFQDRYYIKLSIFSESDTTLPLLISFAENISEQIGVRRDMPEIFSRFPDENRIDHSEQYIFQAPLGHAFLPPVFSVQYQNGREISTLLVSETDSEKESIRLASKLMEHFSQMGELERVEKFNVHAFYAEGRYQNNTLVVPYQQYLFILQDPPDDGILFMEQAIGKIAGD